MADNIYRDYDQRSRRDRSQSIFSDDSSRGRWNEDRDRNYGRGRDEDRGFFEKAGEEIRSWFGDDDDRGERSRYGSGRSYGRRDNAHPQSWGQANDMDDDRSRRIGSRQDDHYRTWRERQMAELDRDYEDYCRERQQQFDNDFSTWRRERQQNRTGNQTGRSSAGTGSMTGTGGTSRTGDTTAASGRTGTTASSGSSGSSGRSRTATGGSSGETGSSGDDSPVKSSATATQGRSSTRSRS